MTPNDRAAARARRQSLARFVVSLLLTLVTGATMAAEAPAAFKGFGNSKDPIQIEADNMNVATPDQIVTFSGNVIVHQKTATLTTQELKVFYDNTKPAQTDATPTPAPATPAPAATPTAPNAQLKRFEASGGLKIAEPDQTVTGESGWFDMSTQKAEVNGHVVLTHGKDVATGSKMQINLKTGIYKLEGRVQMLLNPGTNDGASTPAKPK